MKPRSFVPVMLALAAAVAVVLFAAFGIGAYNRLVALDQAADAQWSQVENVYQRRADLVPNLVATVKGAAKFEQETLTRVIEARSRATQLTPSGGAPRDKASFEKMQAAQDELSSALSRLLVVVESYPQLGATAAFRDLMTQLEGTENRIAVERMRFNDTARAFNVERQRFPTVLVATMFGNRFADHPYFKASEGTQRAPEVVM